MSSGSDKRREELQQAALPRRPAEEVLEELLFTLELCRRALPWDAHPEHYDRLRRIEGMVHWCLEGR